MDACACDRRCDRDVVSDIWKASAASHGACRSEPETHGGGDGVPTAECCTVRPDFRRLPDRPCSGTLSMPAASSSTADSSQRLRGIFLRWASRRIYRLSHVDVLQ